MKLHLHAWHKAIIRKWGTYGRTFGVQKIVYDIERLFNRKHLHVIVLYIDKWASIVEIEHLKGGCHLAYKDTSSKIGDEGCLVGVQLDGIPKAFPRHSLKKPSTLVLHVTLRNNYKKGRSMLLTIP